MKRGFSKRAGRRAMAWLLAGCIAAAACQLRAAPTPAPAASPAATSPTAPAATPAVDVPTPTGGPAASRVTLRLWVSPDAAPNENTAGGRVLAAQLDAFAQASPGISVEVRVKKVTGAGGLLDFLRTAAAAAPAALPDVIALSRDDLVLAAGEGLLQPLDPLLPAEALDDLYPLPAAAARVDETLYGLPFSAEATVLAYDTEARETAPVTWSDVLTPTGTLLFPAGDPLGLVTLQQYQALGGSLSDEAGHLALNASLLAQVLEFYRSAVSAGVLLGASVDYSEPAATWIAYREHRATLAAAPASLYLREHDRVASTAVTLLPTRDGAPLALGAAWSYALVASDPSRQGPALALMQWLVAPENAGDWSQAAGVLPVRADALAAWGNPDLAALAGRVMAAAVLQPRAADLAVLGPALRQAVTDVIAGRAQPQAAAERAAAAVAGQ